MNSKVKDLVKISIFCFFNLPALMSLESKDLDHLELNLLSTHFMHSMLMF